MEFRREDSSDSDPEEIASLRGTGATLPLHTQSVGERLYVQTLARFGVAAGMILAGYLAKFVFQIEELGLWKIGLLGIAIVAVNSVFFIYASEHRAPERRQPAYRRLFRVFHLSIDLDFLFLTIALAFVGGARSPFQALYFIHVTLAAASLTPLAACVHALIGNLMFAVLVLGDWSLLIRVDQPPGLTMGTGSIDGTYALTIIGMQTFTMGLSVLLVTSLTRLLREGEQKVQETNAALERALRVQRDFLHIALHDMRAPVHATGMLLRSLAILKGEPLSEQQQKIVERAQIRLQEANNFLTDFGVLAVLDAANFERESADIPIAALAAIVIEQNNELLQENRHMVCLDVPEELPCVHGIPRLIHESIANLLTNACKYTPPGGRITLRGRRTDKGVRIEVEDNGIGIAPEDQLRLFQEFVRIRRKDSPVGEVPGSGLGLSIVRSVIEAHNGVVGVHSELGKGSVFYVELPVRTGGET